MEQRIDSGSLFNILQSKNLKKNSGFQSGSCSISIPVSFVANPSDTLHFSAASPVAENASCSISVAVASAVSVCCVNTATC